MNKKLIAACIGFIIFIGLAYTVFAGKQGGPPPGMAIKVVSAPVTQETITEEVLVVGSLAANESVELLSEIDGQVDNIQFKEGQNVSSGETLLTIDSKKLAASMAQAEANYNLAKANLTRSNSLVKQRTISKQEYDKAKSDYAATKAALELTAQQLKDATITAPFSGTLGARHVSPGQYLRKGELVTTLVNNNPIKIEFQVPERYFSQLKDGLLVKLSVEAFPNDRFTGKIYFIAPEIDSSTRTVMVKALVPNPDNYLRAGMFANVTINLKEKTSALTIPESAVMMNGKNSSVFIISEDSKAMIKPVKLGLRMKGKVEVIEGLNTGEKVIIEGIQKLGPGVKVADGSNTTKPKGK